MCGKALHVNMTHIRAAGLKSNRFSDFRVTETGEIIRFTLRYGVKHFL